MKAINLLLEEDEIMLLRMQVRMMELMLPETNEQIDAFIKKILEATDELDSEWKKEIGKTQRAMRRVKETFQYAEFMGSLKVIEKLLVKEISKEKDI